MTTALSSPLRLAIAWSRHDKHLLLIDDKSDSTTDNETDSLFDKSDDNIDDTDHIEILSDKSDNDSNIDGEV